MGRVTTSLQVAWAADSPQVNPAKSTVLAWGMTQGAVLSNSVIIVWADGLVYDDCSEPYCMAIVIDDSAEPYALAALFDDSVEPYSMAIVINDSVEAYGLTSMVFDDCSEIYGYLSEVINDMSELYGMLTAAQENIISDSVERYSLLKTDAEIIQNTASVTVAGIAVDFLDFSVSCDEGSYCFSFTGEAADLQAYLACAEEAELVATINGEEFSFLVDSREINRDTVSGFSVSARSKTKTLDFPYCEPVTFSGTATTAKAFIVGKAAEKGITVSFEIVDWPLPTGIFVMDGESILSGIKKLADAAGAIIQSTKDGNLVVRYDYPVSPTSYADGDPAMVLSDINDIFVLSSSHETSRRFNSVIVSNQEAKDEPAEDSANEVNIIIELDEVRNGGKGSFSKADKLIYVRVYSTDAYAIDLTSGAAQKIAADEEATITDEVITFQFLELPTTSRPSIEIVSVEWMGDDLGEVTIFDGVENQIQASGQTADSIGIAKVTYKTKYDVWQIVPPAYSENDYSLAITGIIEVSV